MNILLLGKTGQVGTELTRSLLPLGKLTALERAQADLSKPHTLLTLLQQHKPDCIVNAAAYTAVDRAEQAPEEAFAVNHLAVDVLANYAAKTNCLLVHYSTDYVFDGMQTTPYQETDSVNPQNTYGASKAAGETAILSSGAPHLIFRTSWVFSATGHNFIRTILKAAQEKTALRVVNDQHGAPTSAEFLADITALAIYAYYHQSLQAGLYHLTPSGMTNWHALACYVVQKALARGLPLKVDPNHITPISTADYPLPAKRPLYSVLSTNRLQQALPLQFPEWTVYVDRMISLLLTKTG